MSGELTSVLTHIRSIVTVEDGLQINLFRTLSGAFQANVKERGSDGWGCHTDDDPIAALELALRRKATGSMRRDVGPAEGDSIEDLIG